MMSSIGDRHMGVGDRSLVGDSGDLVGDSRGRDSSKSVSIGDGLDKYFTELWDKIVTTQPNFNLT